jgi:hypothetical protein
VYPPGYNPIYQSIETGNSNTQALGALKQRNTYRSLTIDTKIRTNIIASERIIIGVKRGSPQPLDFSVTDEALKAQERDDLLRMNVSLLHGS